MVILWQQLLYDRNRLEMLFMEGVELLYDSSEELLAVLNARQVAEWFFRGQAALAIA